MQIGQIVALLMQRHDLTLEAVAERVRAQGATNVRYQHIQQLIEFPNRRPRFLPELARAFGLTTEKFLDFKPEVGTSVAEPNAIYDASHSVGYTPETLAAAYQLLRLSCRSLEVTFDPEDPADAELVLLGCAYLASRNEQVVTPNNVIDFISVLRRTRGEHVARGTSAGGARQGAGGEGSERAAG